MGHHQSKAQSESTREQFNDAVLHALGGRDKAKEHLHRVWHLYTVANTTCGHVHAAQERQQASMYGFGNFGNQGRPDEEDEDLEEFGPVLAMLRGGAMGEGGYGENGASDQGYCYGAPQGWGMGMSPSMTRRAGIPSLPGMVAHDALTVCEEAMHKARDVLELLAIVLLRGPRPLPVHEHTFELWDSFFHARLPAELAHYIKGECMTLAALWPQIEHHAAMVAQCASFTAPSSW